MYVFLNEEREAGTAGTDKMTANDFKSREVEVLETIHEKLKG